MSLTSPRRLLLASIHDVSPRFESEIDGLIDLLAPHVGTRLAMLVVPNHWGDSPIVPGTPFAGRLRSWAEQGVEMFLHGFTHRDDAQYSGAADRVRARFMTASEGEFLGLSHEEATARINDGRNLIEGIIGRPIDGFVAPAWLYGEGAREALEEAAQSPTASASPPTLATADLLRTAADPALTEDFALALLKRADLPPEVIEQLAKILKISADVLYFYARRVPGDVIRDFDEGSIEAAYRAFRNTLKESSTTGRSHAQAGARGQSVWH